MKKILILGAGKIGVMISTLLSHPDEGGVRYEVTVADQDERAFEKFPALLRARAVKLDVADGAQLAALMTAHDVVINALPFFLTEVVASAAAANGCHYLDLTEDVKSTKRVRELANSADTAFIPQCGLAPGFISIAAYNVAQRFDTLRDVHMRVGALPQYPANALKYNLTWSTDGLINEYLHPCEAVVNGTLTTVAPLEGLSIFSLDGTEYECFNTSGGLGSLAETLAGKVESLNYKSVRYPGHNRIIRMLLHDLRLGQDPLLMKKILENAIPATTQDVVLVYVNVVGEQGGRLMKETYTRKIYNREIAGQRWSAIQITTASGICAVLDLLCGEKLPQKGFVKQEDIPFEMFIKNRFGKNYHYDG
jgi:saccharopine dehydrogenase-like NADP-dependent oxidoreductase